MVVFQLYDIINHCQELLELKENEIQVFYYIGKPFQYEFIDEDNKIKYIKFIRIEFLNGQDVGEEIRNILFDNPYADIEMPLNNKITYDENIEYE